MKRPSLAKTNSYQKVHFELGFYSGHPNICILVGTLSKAYNLIFTKEYENNKSTKPRFKKMAIFSEPRLK